MNKEHRDGLFMDNSILIMDLKKSEFHVQTRFIECLAILIGSWSSLSILLESIPVPATISKLNITILLCSAIVYILSLIPVYDAVKLFFGILFYTLFLISRFPRLQNGFYIMENVVIERMEHYYDIRLNTYLANYETGIIDSTLLMIMISIPVITLLVIAIVRGRFISVTSIVLFLPIAASFLLGITPSEKYLVAYIVAVLYLTRSGFSAHQLVNKKQKTVLHRINSWAGVWLSLISLLLFFMLKLVISQDNYAGFTQIRDMKKDIQTKLFSINLEDFTESVANFKLPDFNSTKGGLDGGSLGRTGKVEYTGSDQLRITTSYGAVKDGVYLKGYVGSNYTGDRWVGYTDKEAAAYREFLDKLPDNYLYPLNQTIELINAGKHAGVIKRNKPQSMQIEYIDANKRFIYSPYFTNYRALDNINYKQDLYTTPRKQTSSYSYEYYNLVDPAERAESLRYLDHIYQMISYDEEAYIKFEQLYNRFVEQTYTKLPENGLERLKKQLADVLKHESLQTVDNKILYIKEYLSSNTSYTLKPGKVPQDKDYVEYFLYDNKKGYCSHYASAAVLMLRGLGVPARYVEGYTISPSDIVINTVGEASFFDNDYSLDTNIKISVKDYNAHAWVEIYQNGIGWIPVEFTPPGGIGYNAYIQEEINAPTITAPITKELTPTPIVKNEQDDTLQPGITKPVDKPGDIQINEKHSSMDSLQLTLLILFTAAVICLIALMVLRRKIRFKEANRDYKAIYFFSRVEKIINFVRGKTHQKTNVLGYGRRLQLEDNEDYMKSSFYFIDSDAFDSFMNTVKKARYGRNRITKKELEQVEEFHDSILMRIYCELPFIKKVFLRLILFVK